MNFNYKAIDSHIFKIKKKLFLIRTAAFPLCYKDISCSTDDSALF